MKKALLLVSSLFISSSMLIADITIKSGWQLLSAPQTMGASIFNNTCVDYLWKYDTTQTTPEWKVHIANGRTYSHTSSTFTVLNQGEGFWTKGNGACVIPLADPTVVDNNETNTSTDTNTTTQTKVVFTSGNDSAELTLGTIENINLLDGDDSIAIAASVAHIVNAGDGNDSIELYSYTKNDWNNNVDNIQSLLQNFENFTFSDGVTASIQTVSEFSNSEVTYFPGNTPSSWLDDSLSRISIKEDGSFVSCTVELPSSFNQLNQINKLYSSSTGFLALTSTNELLMPSSIRQPQTPTSNIKSVSMTEDAFVAVTVDGDLISWGLGSGGNDAYSANLLREVEKASTVYTNRDAFAALLDNGSVFTWGHSRYGGDSSDVAGDLDGTTKVTSIYSTSNAFAALRENGSVITWGSSSSGGDSADVVASLSSGVINVFANIGSFAALKSDGSVITWGNSSYGGDSSDIANDLNGTIKVKAIYATTQAFSALREDGSVISWGSASAGGDSSDVTALLTTNVQTLYTTERSFAALKKDGSVITWGSASDGGDSSTVANDLNGTIKVTSIYAAREAFAALREDNTVVVWGNEKDGGSTVDFNVGIGLNDIKKIHSHFDGFTAIRNDGTAVSWGGRICTGNFNNTVSMSQSYIEHDGFVLE